MTTRQLNCTMNQQSLHFELGSESTHAASQMGYKECFVESVQKSGEKVDDNRNRDDISLNQGQKSNSSLNCNEIDVNHGLQHTNSVVGRSKSREGITPPENNGLKHSDSAAQSS